MSFFKAAAIAAMLFFCALTCAGRRQPGAFEYTGIFQLHDQGLSGDGVKITSVCRSETYIDREPQNDYLWNIDHDCFLSSQITLSNGLGGISGHATSIGGILAGYDTDAFITEIGDFKYTGAVFNAQIDVFEFWRFVSSYASGMKKLKTDILTMSVGVVFEDWWTRGIERLAENDGLIVIAGIGNGSDVYDPAYYPAAGANVIGVGVIDSILTNGEVESLEDFWLARPEHSSSGPTWDGRSGVDIIAPGNCLVPDSNNLDGYSSCGSWTSFAAPVVAGTVGLLVEKAKSHPELAMAVSKEGGNCVIKAILLNSAKKMPYWHKGAATKDDDHKYSLDFIQGAGRLDAVGALDQLVAGKQAAGIVAASGWNNDIIDKSDDSLKYYKFEISNPGNKYITVTLVWNKHFKDEFPFKPDEKINSDLRVELWAADSSRPGQEYLLDYCDTVNDNVEHIYCAADPNCDSYEIVVTANDSKSGGSERYALAWSVREKEKTKEQEWFDLNGDGKVDADDFAIMLERFDSSADSEDGYLLGDINMDGVINIYDLGEMINLHRPASQFTENRN